MNDSDDIDFIDKIRMEIEETKEEFIYRSILPFCEFVVEKRLSKKELEKILRRGMQPSISLDKVKQARDKIHDEHMKMLDKYRMSNLLVALEILDKLIESEE